MSTSSLSSPSLPATSATEIAVTDTLRVREAILAVVEPHWKTSWRDRVFKFAEQVQVDRQDIFGNKISPHYRIYFLNVDHLAYVIGNSSASTWIFPGSDDHKQLSHWNYDGQTAQRSARNLLGLGHIHDYETHSAYSHLKSHQCRINYHYCACKNDSPDDVPMNLWYTILLSIHKLFINTEPARNELCSNAVYVPSQHDPRLLYSSATYDDKGSFEKWVPFPADKWHQKVGTVCVGGRPNWFSHKDQFVKTLYAGFESTMLDVLFPYSTIKRQVAKQVLEQMTTFTTFTDPTEHFRFQVGNQNLLQWFHKCAVDDTPYPTLNAEVVTGCPTVNRTWITPVAASDKCEKSKVPQISADAYLNAIEFGELLAWMDACNQDMLTILGFFKSPDELDQSNQDNQSNRLEFPSSNDHFPDHTNPLTFRGRLAQTVFAKAFVFYHAILVEIAESAENDDKFSTSSSSANCIESKRSKRLRFLKPVAKIIHNYLPFPTTTPRAKCTSQRISFTQLE